MLAIIIGFTWGVMEGLWFFIVPDVGLSFLALKGWRTAFLSTLAAVIGAMVSAGALYFWSTVSAEALTDILSFWSHIPGYYPKMLDVASEHLKKNGAMGLLSGPNSGIPYRFYVYEALKLDLPLLDVWLWTPLARLERILIAPVTVLILRWCLSKVVVKWWPQYFRFIKGFLIALICIYWLGIYIWYWGSFLPLQYG